MVEVHTREEALAIAENGLAQWFTTATGIVTQAQAVVDAACVAGDQQVRTWQIRVRALEQLLASADRDSDTRQLEAQLASARAKLETSQRATQQINQIKAEVSSLHRTTQHSGQRVDAARADLRSRAGDLDAYRRAGSGRSSGSGGAGGSSSGSSSAEDSEKYLKDKEITEFDVNQADYSDNPIQTFERTSDVTRADYRWAVQTWDEVVKPGLQNGMTRDDFAARDAARGAAPLRRTADVYDMFLGSEPIHLSRNSAGGLTVNGGRHRIEVARELGITRLPGKIFGP